MTDNALAYTKAVTVRQTLAELGVMHVRSRSRRPRINGKVKRLNRTLLEEWAYVRTNWFNHARSRLFDRFPAHLQLPVTRVATRRPASHDTGQQRSEPLSLVLHPAVGTLGLALLRGTPNHEHSD
jgi:transposase InsO family protein